MEPLGLIQVERQGDAFWARLRKPRLDEAEIYQLADELLSLAHDQGCRHLALSLGPEPLVGLYSVFLAKLVSVQRTLAGLGGELVLCDVSPMVLPIFEACKLDTQFHFVADFPAALARWGR